MAKKPQIIELKKHSAIIQMSNIITADQRKIFNVLLRDARETLQSNPNQEIFYIDIKSIKDLSGIKATNNKQLKENLLKIKKTDIDFNILGKDKKRQWGSYSLLGQVGFDETTNLVRFGFTPTIRLTLRDPEMFSLLDLSLFKDLKSKYSIALYELAVDYIGAEIPEMTVDIFRELMGIQPHQYSDNGMLKSLVIFPAIKEINLKTDIDITYFQKTLGIKIISIKFLVEKKKEQLKLSSPKLKQTITIQAEISDNAERLYSMLPIAEQIPNRKYMLEDWLRQYPFERLCFDIKHAKARATTNLWGYLTTSARFGLYSSEEFKQAQSKKAKQEAKKIREAEEKFKKEIQQEKADKEFKEKNQRCLDWYNSLSKKEQNKINEELQTDSYFKYNLSQELGYQIDYYLTKTNLELYGEIINS